MAKQPGNWGNFNNEEEAFQCFLAMFQRMQAGVVPQTPPQPIAAPRNDENTTPKRGPQQGEQKTPAIPKAVNEKGVPTLAQREEHQDTFWEKVLDEISCLLRKNRDFLQQLTRDAQKPIDIYTDGIISSEAEKCYPRGSATAVVWFNEHCPLNLKWKYSADTFRHSNNDARIIATIIALFIAKMSHMGAVCIKSTSGFVKIKMESHDYSGDSYELLGKLRIARKDFPNASFEKCNDFGTKGAKNFAGQG